MQKSFPFITILLIVVAIAPFWLIPIDFWDGRIIDYAMKIGDLRGLKLWFFTSRWYLQYALYAFIYQLADITGISYRLWFAACASVAVLGIAFETFLYARRTLRLPHPYDRTAGYLALFFPAWHTLASSDLLIHALCVWWLLLGYRLSKIRPLLGIVFIILSFQLNSLVTVLIGLCVADCLMEYSTDKKIARATWRRFALLTALAVLALILRMMFFPAYGAVYEGYNQIIAFDSAGNMVLALRLLCRYLVWPVVVLGIACSGYLLAIAVAAAQRKPLRGILQNLGRALACGTPIALVLLLLFFAGLTPYIVVHKYAKFNEFADWTQRNAYVLCLPLSIMAAWLSYCMEKSLGGARVISCICILGFASLVYIGYSEKIERSSLEFSIVQDLKNMPQPQAGVVFLRYAPKRGITWRAYESNWLLWRAYGHINWVSAMAESGTAQDIKLDDMTHLAMSSDDPALRLGYLLPDFKKVTCTTDIAFTGKRLSGFQAWAWRFGLHSPPDITATVENASCAKPQQ